MVLAAAGFAVVPVSVRQLADRLPVFEIIFWRNLLALIPSVPIMLRVGTGVFVTRRPGAHAVRAGFTYFAMLTYFWGILVVPLADATAIQFLIPVFSALGGVVFFRERASWRRAGPLLLGFGGALLVVRPGFAAVGLHSMAVLASAFFYAGAWLMVKRLSTTEAASVITFYMNLMLLPVSLLPALPSWVLPSPRDFSVLLLLGLGGWVAHYAQARAFARAAVGVVAPLDFLRLPFVAVAAYLLFGQVPHPLVWAGALLIVLAATAIARADRSGRAASRQQRPQDTDRKGPGGQPGG